MASGPKENKYIHRAFSYLRPLVPNPSYISESLLELEKYVCSDPGPIPNLPNHSLWKLGPNMHLYVKYVKYVTPPETLNPKKMYGLHFADEKTEAQKS